MEPEKSVRFVVKMKGLSYIKGLLMLLIVAFLFASCQKENEMFSTDSNANSALNATYDLGVDGDEGVTDKDDNENDNDGGKEKGVTDKDDNENDNDGGKEKGNNEGGVTDKDNNENDNDGGSKVGE